MEEQSYARHAKLVPMFHFVLLPLLLAAFLASIYNLYEAVTKNQHQKRVAVILVVLSFCMILTSFFARVFALKAQDRAIRAEENLRHFVITGKLLDKRLSVKQIVGLRFASDAEFPALAAKAANENLPIGEIKKSVQNWKVDTDRL